MPRYLQINANRSAAAMDLAWATAIEDEALLILVSEPNKASIKGTRWYKDQNGDAAIGYVGPRTVVNATGGGYGFVWVQVDMTFIYSCYISPNVNMNVFEEFVNALNVDIMAKNSDKVILSGDFNSKSPLWGSTVTDKRGEILGEMISSIDLVALNEWGVHTFRRRGSGSTIDVTAVSESLVSGSTRWNVLEEKASLSPHLYILFTIEHSAPHMHRGRWIRGPIDKQKIAEELRSPQGNEPATVNNLTETLKRAHNRATRAVRTVNGRAPYWWTAEIAELRAEVLTRRRTTSRLRARLRIGEAELIEADEEYRKSKKKLRTAICLAKRRSWNLLLEEVDEDVYGEGYKIVMRHLKITSPPLNLTKEMRDEQVRQLFPAARERQWERGHVNSQIPEFSYEELVSAAVRLKNGKAPGRDRIPAEVIKIAVEVMGNGILRVLNDLLRMGSFPQEWKEAKLVLVEKPRKTVQQLPSYRPLCLINTMSKLYEHLILGRLVAEVENARGISIHQHGFRKGHSTVAAVEEVLHYAREAHRRFREWCLVVLIDIRNAFNTASWEKIVLRLEEMGISAYLTNIIKDYLTDRAIYKEDKEKIRIHVGVPQGSVLGPTLWNVMYDGVLRTEVPEGVNLVGYADDLAVVVSHKDIQGLEDKTNHVIRRIGLWLRDNGLEMAPEKTETILLHFGRRKHRVTINVNGVRVESKDTVKYLGITLDGALSFGPHIRAAAEKAGRTASALCKLMPNVGGPSEERRRILGAVAQSVILYGAPVWHESLRVAAYRRTLHAVQRQLALRICRAYRTASFAAVTVLASLMPIHLLAMERQNLFRLRSPGVAERKAERNRMLEIWQDEWTRGTQGAWTRTLIEDLRPWVTRGHGQLNFHLTQLLTGHGAFRSYTLRIGKSQGGDCDRCAQQDTAEHVLFQCSKFHTIREETNTRMGTILNSGNMVNLMLQSPENWNTVSNYARRIMTLKEEEERTE